MDSANIHQARILQGIMPSGDWCACKDDDQNMVPVLAVCAEVRGGHDEGGDRTFALLSWMKTSPCLVLATLPSPQRRRGSSQVSSVIKPVDATTMISWKPNYLVVNKNNLEVKLSSHEFIGNQLMKTILKNSKTFVSLCPQSLSRGLQTGSP